MSNSVSIYLQHSSGLLAPGGVNSTVFWFLNLYLNQQPPAIIVVEWKGREEKAGERGWSRRKWPSSLAHNMNSNEGNPVSVFILYKYPQQFRDGEKALEQKPAESRLQCSYSGMWEALGSGAEIPQQKRYAGGNHQLLLLAPASRRFNKAAFSHSVEMHSISRQAN